MLKQNQYKPLPVEKEVVIIYVVINGYLDDVAINKIKDFENKFYKYFDEKYQDVAKEIKEKKILDDELKLKLDAIIKEFKASFLASL